MNFVNTNCTCRKAYLSLKLLQTASNLTIMSFVFQIDKYLSSIKIRWQNDADNKI